MNVYPCRICPAHFETAEAREEARLRRSPLTHLHQQMAEATVTGDRGVALRGGTSRPPGTGCGRRGAQPLESWA